MNSKRMYVITKERNPGAVVFVKVPQGWYTFDNDIDALTKAYPAAVVAANFARIANDECKAVIAALRGRRCMFVNGETFVDKLRHG